MSGSTIGGVVGGAIGFVFGGPAGAQVGWMIGSAVGGYVDPVQIQGPRLRDMRGQTSAVGGTIPKGWGTFPAPCNIIWQQDGVTEHRKEERQGKGGGTETVTYTYTRSYAVMCHIGEIAGFLQIKRNGKIVYDARDDDTIADEYVSTGGFLVDALAYIRRTRAENKKFLNKCTFYNGTQTQNPDPTIEEHKGVNNVSAYRGRAYFVVTDDDVTELQGAIPQYEVIIAACGTVTPFQENQLFSVAFDGELFRGDISGLTDNITPSDQGDVNAYVRLAGGLLFYAGNDSANVVQVSPDFGNTWIPATGIPATSTTNKVFGIGRTSAGWIVAIRDDAYVYISQDGFSYSPVLWSDDPAHGAQTDGMVVQGDVVIINFAEVSIVARRSTNGGLTWSNTDFTTLPSAGSRIYAKGSVVLGPQVVAGPPPEPYFRRSESFGRDGTWSNTAETPFGSSWVAFPSSRWVSLDFAGNIQYSDNSGVTWLNGGSVPADGLVGSNNRLISGNGVLYFGGDNATKYSTDNGATWSNIPGSQTSMSLAVNAQDDGSQSVPDAPGYYVDANGNVTGPTGGFITPCGSTTIGEVIGEVCETMGLDPTEYDVSDLTDVITGYVIARETDGASIIDSLQPLGMFDTAEWDAKLRFIKRGGTALASINSDDLVERDGDAFERTMVQEVELLRSVTIGYIDPLVNYAPTTQKWERRVGTIDARGDASIEVSAVLVGDDAATAAARRGLTAWGEPERQKFCLPYRLSKFTPTDIINYTHSNGEVITVRLMQIDDESGHRYIESANNCAEAYDTIATGAQPKPPTITDVRLYGPTVLYAMNLDSLRAEDNVAGMYFSAVGLLAGWLGCVVEMSRDGGVTYQPIVTITEPATMGYLTDHLGMPTSGGDQVKVFLYGGTSMSSITNEQMDAFVNASAILTDGVAEMVQPQTVTAEGSGRFTLDDTERGLKDTAPSEHDISDYFVLLNTAVVFVPIDVNLAGQTLYFRAVTIGTSSDAAVPFTAVYEPPTFVLDGGGA